MAYGLYSCGQYSYGLYVYGLYTPPGKKTSAFVSTVAQYRAPTFRERTAMKLGPGPKGV